MCLKNQFKLQLNSATYWFVSKFRFFPWHFPDRWSYYTKYSPLVPSVLHALHLLCKQFNCSGGIKWGNYVYHHVQIHCVCWFQMIVIMILRRFQAETWQSFYTACTLGNKLNFPFCIYVFMWNLLFAAFFSQTVLLFIVNNLSFTSEQKFMQNLVM